MGWPASKIEDRIRLEGDSMSAVVENKQTSAVEETQELVKLTARAAEKVKAIRAEEKIEDGYGLRLKVMGGGCSGFAYDLFFDQAQDVDQTFESQGVRMVCDQMSLMYLVGTEIDYVESVQGSGFKFTNPNVKSTCGCGSSFSV
jgi:iron-sulfur cluster assembly accessory protein